jgi:hypothetical protein
MAMPDPGPGPLTEGGDGMAATAQNDHSEDHAATNAGDHSQSRNGRSLFRGMGKVIPLRQERDGGQNWPTRNQEEPGGTGVANSGPNSGPGITLSDLPDVIPGDWASVTSVWTESPEPLSELVGRVAEARHPERSGAEIALACWALLVLVPRGLLHLGSWVLTHPLRLLAAAALVAVFVATL